MRPDTATPRLTPSIWFRGYLAPVRGCWKVMITEIAVTNSPLEIIFADIEKALRAQIWHAALVSALCIPDICSVLNSPPDESWNNRQKYVNWFNANLGTKYAHLTGDDCFNIRGGIVHKGTFGHPKSRYDAVMFMIPNARRIVIHDGFIGGSWGTGTKSLALDLETFCKDIIAAARKWYADNENDPNLQANLPNLVRLRPEGLLPYISGAPLIA